MSYSTMLFEILREKNLTDREVVNKCKENGDDISEAYFNKIKNNIINPPSEKVSRAIAKACGVDERLLVIEGYIDKSPKEIQEAFKTINFMAKSATAKFLKVIKKGNMKELQKYLDNQPVSDTIIEILDSKEEYLELLEDNYTFENLGNFNFSVSLKEPVFLKVEDNAMFPILQKGDRVEIEVKTTYNSNDILLVEYQNKKYYRYVHKVNTIVQLIPICKDYKEMICDEKDIKRLGKVKNVIRKI